MTFNNEQIEDFISGQLSGDEKKSFQQQLTEVPELAAEVSFRQDIEQALNDEAALDFQKLVQEKGAAYLAGRTGGKVRQLRSFNRLFAIAAAVLVLVASAVFVWQQFTSTPVSGPELYAAYFEPYPLDQTQRGESDASDAIFEQGVQLYRSANYDEAITAFEEVAAADQQDVVTAFALANAYLNAEPAKSAAALVQFQKIIDHNRSVFVYRAKWFSALIHLQNEDLAQAKPLLQEVANSSDNLREKAEDLLAELGE